MNETMVYNSRYCVIGEFQVFFKVNSGPISYQFGEQGTRSTLKENQKT